MPVIVPLIGNIGLPELLLIFGFALLFFGAKRLPEIGSSLGKGIKEFRKSFKDVRNSIDEDDTPEPRQLDGSSTPTSSSEMSRRDGEPKRLSD
jgi:sec-independent protein translocase protein TatA